MNEKKKYLLGSLAISVAFALSLQITVLLMVVTHRQGFGVALPVETAVAFIALFWWIRRFRGRFSQATAVEPTKAARNARSLGIIYIVAPVFVYLTQGSALFALPYRLGFILPILPLGLAVHYLRLSATVGKDTAGEVIPLDTP